MDLIVVAAALGLLTTAAYCGYSVILVAMASGGMDTLPHNRAVIATLAVTGLTQIAVHYLTGLV